MAKVTKSKTRKRNVKSKAKEQQKLINLSKQVFSEPKDIFGVFLIRQGLKGRTEQFTTLAISEEVAVAFCRNTLMPKYCASNQKESMHTLGKDNEPLRVNYTNDLLLIKRIDFVRTEEGRTNSNPLWYWNIAKLTIITSKHLIAESDNGTT